MLDGDFDPDSDKRTIRETERISDNQYNAPAFSGSASIVDLPAWL